MCVLESFFSSGLSSDFLKVCCVCHVHACAHKWAGVQKRPKGIIGFPRAGVTGSYEFRDVCVGNETQVTARAIHAFNSWAISPAPRKILLNHCIFFPSQWQQLKWNQLGNLSESTAAHLLSSILQWLMCMCVALPRYLLKHYSGSFCAGLRHCRSHACGAGG